MEEVLVVVSIFIALPWIVLHYVTKWKTAATITSDDENLLEDLYQLAKRLDARMDTVERLVGDDHPEFQTARIQADRQLEHAPLRKLDELEELVSIKKGTKK